MLSLPSGIENSRAMPCRGRTIVSSGRRSGAGRPRSAKCSARKASIRASAGHFLSAPPFLPDRIRARACSARPGGTIPSAVIPSVVSRLMCVEIFRELRVVAGHPTPADGPAVPLEVGELTARPGPSPRG